MDVGEMVVMPGLVDTHVHINEPGRTTWEGFETATKAAAAGGVTTLVDMPLNSSPVTTTADALAVKRAASVGKCFVDVGFHGGLIHGNAGRMTELCDAGVLGMKAFLVHSGIDEFPAAVESDLLEAMKVLSQRGVPLLAHAEVDWTPPDVLPNEDPRSYARYVATRPPVWEIQAIEMLIRLSEETGCWVHVVHLATEKPLPMLVAARKRGVKITVETCPHYLFFTAEEIPDGGTQYKCAPPIRAAETREGLWKGLLNGAIDMIASDHSPCPPEMKLLDVGNFGKAWGGICSLQLGLGIVWTQGEKRGVCVEQIAEWMSGFPAKLAGLKQKGAIAAGKDADLVVWDLAGAATIKGDELHHRHKVTPYEGETLHGLVRKTFLRGQLIAQDGVVMSPPTGKLLSGRSNA